MRHHITGRKFGRTSSHRKALFRNLSISLIKDKMLRTTLAKAKELRKVIEPLITLSKKQLLLEESSCNNISADLVSLRRKANKFLNNKLALKELFEKIGPRYKKRKGGYTQIVKSGYRFGDKSPLAIIKFL